MRRLMYDVVNANGESIVDSIRTWESAKRILKEAKASGAVRIIERLEPIVEYVPQHKNYHWVARV